MAGDRIFIDKTPISPSATRYYDSRGGSGINSGQTGRFARLRSAYSDSDGILPTAYEHSEYRSSQFWSQVGRYWNHDDFNERVVGTGSFGSWSRQRATYLEWYSPAVYPRTSTFVNTSYPVSGLNNRLLDKIDNQSFDLGTILAESLETSVWIASRATTIGRFALQLATGNVFGAFRTVGLSRKNFNAFKKVHGRKSIADRASAAWLEYGWSIAPLIGDISDIARLEADPVSVMRRIRTKVTAREHDTDVVKRVLYDYRMRWEVERYLSASVIYTVSNPETVARKALGLGSVPASVWQVVPFSWLIDYVVDVGDYLRLRNAADGLSFRGGYYSLKLLQKGTINYALSTTGWNRHTKTVQTVAVSGSDYGRAYKRWLMGYFPRPSLSIDGRVTGTRIANLAAVSYRLRNL